MSYSFISFIHSVNKNYLLHGRHLVIPGVQRSLRKLFYTSGAYTLEENILLNITETWSKGRYVFSSLATWGGDMNLNKWLQLSLTDCLVCCRCSEKYFTYRNSIFPTILCILRYHHLHFTNKGKKAYDVSVSASKLMSRMWRTITQILLSDKTRPWYIQNHRAESTCYWNLEESAIPTVLTGRASQNR